MSPRSFEDELSSLEKAVRELESGDMTLEEAIRSFESGFQSMKNCYRILKRAQNRVETLTAEARDVLAGVEEENDDMGADPAAKSPLGSSFWKPLNLRSIPELEREEAATAPGESGGRAPAAGTSPRGKPARKGQNRKGEGDERERPLSYADDFASDDD